jgi:tetraprenyl-beta-curcumene synthase
MFAAAALRYWLLVFPRVACELGRLHRLAGQIPDPILRRTALEALGERANLEGAAAFAAFVPGRQRRHVVRALVSFQAIYNHADTLAEQPDDDPTCRSRHLHKALLMALDLDQSDGFAVPRGVWARDAVAAGIDAGEIDGGYMAALVDRCRAALTQLPAYARVAPTAQTAAERIIDFQSLSLGVDGELESWARRQTPIDCDLEWWELAAGAGSSLGVYALIAAAASPMLDEQDVAAIEAAYFPWIGALHSLLDSLVDRSEDAATGQLSLVGCYSSAVDASVGLQRLASAAMEATGSLANAQAHSLLLTAMACSYLAMPEAFTPDAEPLARGVRASIGPLAGTMLRIFRLREFAARVLHGTGAVAGSGRSGAAARVETGERGADARVA